MTRRVIGIGWFSALMVLFLVAIAPACSFGAKARAANARLAGAPANPSAPSSEEEREDEQPRIKGARHSAHSPSTIPVRPPPPRHIASVELVTIGRAPAPRISRAVLPWLHQSRFSERRLI